MAKKFEALMLHAMLKSMRATIVEDELTGSDQQNLYRDMMDQEIATNISNAGGFGIQQVLAQQLGASMGVDGSLGTADNTLTRSRLATIKHYQDMAGANDLMFNTRSSLTQD